MYLSKEIDWIKYLKGRNVYCFGCGHIGIKNSARLKANGINVIGFIDNNTEKQGRVVNGIPVISMEEYKKQNQDMIIICSGREKEIKLQLLENNIYSFISADQIDFGGG